MLRRIVIAVFALGAMVAAPMTAAAAPGDYPPTAPDLTVSATTVVAGGSVTIAGENYTPGETINITVSTNPNGLHYSVGAFVKAADQTTTANAEGSFSATVTLAQVGLTTITAAGASSGKTTSVTVRVTGEVTVSMAPANQGGGGGLSYTGVNRTGLILGAVSGALAIIIGGGLLWLGMTRRRRVHARA